MNLLYPVIFLFKADPVKRNSIFFRKEIGWKKQIQSNVTLQMLVFT